MIVLVCFLLLQVVVAFHVSGRYVNGRMNMLFGGGNKGGGKVIIKVDGKTIESSEKSVNLRKELIANGVDVYPLRAKITGNCGGAGICGTCAVKVLSGMDKLNPPSKNEQNTLRGKPSDFRLSCCAKVSGPISIKSKVN